MVVVVGIDGENATIMPLIWVNVLDSRQGGNPLQNFIFTF